MTPAKFQHDTNVNLTSKTMSDSDTNMTLT